ncbi:hypothetical protein LR48_Vigan197s001800 [Vigna angularis]|uniref:Uncharacterized protein n=2 Tax=Phaseolus angularis TaxID=3914 RepID=A0A0L9T6W6_PHAAN|nr:hypothetical protein LR48_Vigan197s001800 [Vigna angularis]BAT95898.1 hypothetical protein VIGAN_08272800 [Vigna angularis var. angularis]
MAHESLHVQHAGSRLEQQQHALGLGEAAVADSEKWSGVQQPSRSSSSHPASLERLGSVIQQQHVVAKEEESSCSSKEEWRPTKNWRSTRSPCAREAFQQQSTHGPASLESITRGGLHEGLLDLSSGHHREGKGEFLLA